MDGSIISILSYQSLKNSSNVNRVNPFTCDRKTSHRLLLDYEILLYDRAGHGFSSHLPKGSDYSYSSNLQDLRTIIRSKFQFRFSSSHNYLL